MDTIFNDFSIDEQFSDLGEFIDSISKDTLPAMQYLEKNSGFLLLKSKNIFEKNICKNVKFGIFFNSQSFGIPELSRFKRILVQILDEPFWEDTARTEVEAVYKSSFPGEFYGDEPTCLSEALERNAPLLSLRHFAFTESVLTVDKNYIPYSIINMFHKESVCEFLITEKQIGLSEYLLRKEYPLEVSFLCDDKHVYYADQSFEIDEVRSIAETFERHIILLYEGTGSKLTKSITHKGTTYFEFRDKLAQNREFRIFYYRKGNKLIYLNSLLKKTEKTPNRVKDFSVKLIRDYCS